jgi:hypothetical protein
MPTFSATAAYAPGFAGRAYVYVLLAIPSWYFASVMLPIGKVGRLQDGEYPPNFVFKVVDCFWCEDSGNPCDGNFLCGKHFIHAILGLA